MIICWGGYSDAYIKCYTDIFMYEIFFARKLSYLFITYIHHKKSNNNTCKPCNAARLCNVPRVYYKHVGVQGTY